MSKSVVKPHLIAEELQQRMKDSDCIEQYRRYQVIFLRQTKPELPVSTVALMCAVAYRTVTQWTWYYNKYGVEQYILSGKGGRRNCHLSESAEIELLNSLAGKAKKGHVIIALSVKKAAEKIIGHELPKDYAYDLMHRHRWRKIMPHTHHPKKDQTAQETFKETSRTCWIPPEKN